MKGLVDAGFEDVDIEVTRVYDAPVVNTSGEHDRGAGHLVSAFVRATKPIKIV